VIERARAFGAAGAEAIYLQVLDLADHDHLRLIAAAVQPEVS
jgi:2-methylisocitrate lyase-like PEP mutase family enzyme